MMPLRGVRSPWDMEARKSDFMRLADSARHWLSRSAWEMRVLALQQVDRVGAEEHHHRADPQHVDQVAPTPGVGTPAPPAVDP